MKVFSTRLSFAALVAGLAWGALGGGVLGLGVGFDFGAMAWLGNAG